MRCNRSSLFHNGHQGGAVLFVALVFLVLITLLALTATSTSILQERMTGGVHNSQLALMGAETTVRSAEWNIWNKSNGGATSNKLHCGPSGGVTNDACYSEQGQGTVNAAIVAFRNAKTWLGTSDGGTSYATNGTTSLTGISTSSPKATGSLQSQPRYMVEDLGKVLPPNSPSSGEGGGRLALGGFGAGSQVLYSYRITARSTGGNQGSVRAAESVYVALPPSH
jgi:type IV pilus assembly protein PilX